MASLSNAEGRKLLAKVKPLRKGPSKANQFTKSVMAYMSANGTHCWRQNNHAVIDHKRLIRTVLTEKPKTAKHLQTIINKSYNKVRGHVKGIPDILGFTKREAKAVFVEIKIGKDKLSLDQQIFLSNAKRSGAITIVAREWDQFKKEYDTAINAHRNKITLK